MLSLMKIVQKMLIDVKQLLVIMTKLKNSSSPHQKKNQLIASNIKEEKSILGLSIK